MSTEKSRYRKLGEASLGAKITHAQILHRLQHLWPRAIVAGSYAGWFSFSNNGTGTGAMNGIMKSSCRAARERGRCALSRAAVQARPAPAPQGLESRVACRPHLPRSRSACPRPKGFGAHGHRDVEIISYVVSGKLGHKDSMGHEEVLGANEIQVMSAGTGVVHSEFNASPTEPVHFLQIWIEPSQKGFSSNYQQLAFEAAEKSGAWRVLATPEGGSGIARLQQDASVATTELKEGEDRSYTLQPNRHAWIQVVSGAVLLNGGSLKAGDAAAISEEQEITLTGRDASASEVLLFDLA